MTHIKHFGMAALFLTGAGLASPAAAAPLSVPSAAGLAAAQVESVAYGCGPGWAPNRWGDCRPMYRRYGYGRPYRGYYAARGYARPVLYVGPFGAGFSFR